MGQYTAPPHPSVKKIRDLERRIEEQRRTISELRDDVRELERPNKELYAKQKEAGSDLRDPVELEYHRQKAWTDSGKLGFDLSTGFQQPPAEGWPDDVEPEVQVRKHYGLTPDGERLLYSDGGRSEVVRPLEQSDAPVPGTDISNTFIGKLASGQQT
jgi:hypothetical protein